MQWLIDLWHNPYLWAAVISWAAAQIIKTLLNWGMERRLDFKRLWGDGGMPSAHCATVCSLAMMAALADGCGSFAFAVGVVLALIVCRDAMSVRLETGKQAMLLDEITALLEDIAAEDLPEIKLKKLVGHTPLQVLAGGCLGVVTSVILWLLW